MQYENPPVPEVNVSPEHPLKEFAWLLFTLGVFLVAGLLLLYALSGWLLRFVPPSAEALLVDSVAAQFPAPASGPCADARRQELQALGERVARALNMPAEQTVTIHYLDGDTVNAFATLGGQVFIYRGLMDMLFSEEALAMLLAHELAHVKHRDPLLASGRAFTTALALSLLLGGDGTAMTAWLGNTAHQLTALGFSRRQEERADAAAVQALRKLYGHTTGAVELFAVLQQTRSGRAEAPVWLATHPDTAARLQRAMAEQGEASGSLTPRQTAQACETAH